MKWFLLCLRNVMRNGHRTALTMSIFAIGTTAVACALGFVSASFHGLREATIAAQVGHLQVGAPGQFDAFESKPMATGLVPDILARTRQALADQPRVRYSMERLHFEGLIAAGERTLAFVGTGVEPQLESRLSGAFAQVVAGDSLPGPDDPDTAKAVVAVDLARALGVQPGDRITLMATTQQGALNALDLTVTGLYRTGIPELDRRAVLVPLPTAQALIDTDRISRLVVVLDQTEQTDTVAAALARDLPGLQVRTWRELAPFYRQVVSLYGNFVLVLGAIILSVVCVSASNALRMSVMERVRERGTLRAFGIGQRRILGNFLVEGAVVAGLGALAGLLLAAVLSLAVNLSGIQMPAPPGRTTPYPLLIFIEPWGYALVAVAMVGVGVLSAALSQASVRRLSIVQQLGHA